MIAAIASADNAAANEIFFKTVPPDGVSPGEFRDRLKARSRDLHDEFESFVSRETRFEIQVRDATLTADLQDWQERCLGAQASLPASAKRLLRFSRNTRKPGRQGCLRSRDHCARRIIDSPRKGIVR